MSNVISRVKIRLDNSDGTYTEYSCVCPFKVASDGLIHFMGWEENYGGTTKKAREYIKAEKEFLEKEKSPATKTGDKE